MVHEECNHVPMFVSCVVPKTHIACSATCHIDNSKGSNQYDTINVDEEDEEEKFYAINDLAGRVPVSVPPSTQSSLQLNIETTLPVAGSIPTTNNRYCRYYPHQKNNNGGNKTNGYYSNNDGNQLLHALANTNLVRDA